MQPAGEEPEGQGPGAAPWWRRFLPLSQLSQCSCQSRPPTSRPPPLPAGAVGASIPSERGRPTGQSDLCPGLSVPAGTPPWAPPRGPHPPAAAAKAPAGQQGTHRDSVHQPAGATLSSGPWGSGARQTEWPGAGDHTW